MWKSSRRAPLNVSAHFLQQQQAQSFFVPLFQFENDSYTLDCNQNRIAKTENKNKLDAFSVSSFMWNAIHMLSRNQRYY